MASKKNKKDIPYPKLDKEQEVKIFKALAHMTYKKVIEENGLKSLSPESSQTRLISWVSSISKKIRKAPELWNLSQDAVDVIQDALDSRSIRKTPDALSNIAIQQESFRDKLDDMRDMTAEIIMKKLSKYNKSKGYEKVQLRELKDLLSMAIDKSRLLKGESTENIKKLSPIDVESMKPEDALKIVMKARDMLISDKR